MSNGRDYVHERVFEADLNTFIAPSFPSFWMLDSVYWRRNDTYAVDVSMTISYKGEVFTIHKENTTATSFVFPNEQLPEPLIFPPSAKFVFKTDGVTTKDNSVILVWSQA